MSSGNPKRTRSDRVASLTLPPGQWARLTLLARRNDVLLRLALALMAAVIMWAVTGAWAPPFSFRSGYIPPRDLTARVGFTDPDRTEALRQQKRSETVTVYAHDVRPLVELRKALKDKTFQITRAESYGEVDEQVLREFQPPPEDAVQLDEQQVFDALREALAGDQGLSQFEQAVQRAMMDFERHGLLENLQHNLEEGSQSTLAVHPVGDDSQRIRVAVRDVRIAEAVPELHDRLLREFRAAGMPASQAEMLARLVFTWMRYQKLPVTLSLDQEATEEARRKALAQVPPARYQEGDKLVEGGKPLERKDIDLLRREHGELLDRMSAAEMISHSLADFGMYIALYVLCGVYIFYHEPRLLRDLRRFSTLLVLVVFSVALCRIAARDAWRAEIIPLMLFGMTVAIAYQRELALLLSAAVAVVISLSLGQGLAEFVVLVATVAAAILLLGRIRSRTKLTYVGLCAGLVSLLTTIGVGTLVGQAFAASNVAISLPGTRLAALGESFAAHLLLGSVWFGLCSLVAGLLMTALLPFIERLFDVQTDISLLELGDAAHPLLQELARRAPGTYNHSINVASIGEAAAEAIGANGLLVRVGAYFHDIGKMLKPGYFVENQGQSGSRHQSLLPAMSTLVIIAHVKDGADLARQHHLPQSIIDFIEQHHGTTLVEYFFNQAAKQSEGDPDGGEIDETTFRYPGPKPQTPEAGVLMLADAVESASRALVDPAPARIESLVDELAMKRLLDGQFDECGLTLQQLHTIQESLVKSMTAVYHGRVKYPTKQQTA